MAKPIPEGHHSLTPFLNLRDADKAIDFYKKAFGAEEVSRMTMPDGKIGHAELKIGDSFLMVSEAMMEPPYTAGIHLYVKDVDAVFKQAVAAGATVKMPVTDMFWGDRFGRLSDPFGNHWGVATHVEDVSEKDMAARQAEFFKQQKK